MEPPAHPEGEYMIRWSVRLVVASALAFGFVAAPAAAFHDGANHSTTLTQLFNSPNATGAINSDLAFWGSRAYAGNYDGFRIFDISRPDRPETLVDFECFGPQNDPVVYRNKLLFLAVDRTLTGPECGAEATAHDDPTGWEGVRIFDVSNPRRPRLVDDVFTDCGAHTITMYPKSATEILLYVSSYPLRPGPTCGEVNGPANGNSPLHEKISVISVPVNSPRDAEVIAEPKVSYPGDPDNRFDPAEHGLPGPFGDLTACHDIGVFVELGLAAAACAEQAQLWRIGPDGIPDTENPIWVYDDETDTDGVGGGDVAVDFWHSATFSWDGKVVNFIDESFGLGCPPVTNITSPMNPTGTQSDTGAMFFLDTASGEKRSHFVLPRSGETALSPEGDETAYCSAHLGNVVPSEDRYILVNAWYMGGADVIDFTDPANPVEIAFFDFLPFGPTGSDNWSAYWYEGPRAPGGRGLTIYGTDGVHNPATGRGFQVMRADGLSDERLPYLNPQTQERVMALRASAAKARGSRAPRRSTTPSAGTRLAP